MLRCGIWFTSSGGFESATGHSRRRGDVRFRGIEDIGYPSKKERPTGLRRARHLSVALPPTSTETLGEAPERRRLNIAILTSDLPTFPIGAKREVSVTAMPVLVGS